ncbi:HYR domain-containing protein, partial [Chloroflexus sp.]
VDAVSGAVAVTCTPASGSTFPLGTTTVTCTATDAAGNTASGSFTITVTSASAPPVDGPPRYTIFIPAIAR